MAATIAGITRRAVEQLFHMGTPQILDFLEGLKQRPETIAQVVQLVAHIANDEMDVGPPVVSETKGGQPGMLVETKARP